MIIQKKAINVRNHVILLINRIRAFFENIIKELSNEAEIYIKNIPCNKNI